MKVDGRDGEDLTRKVVYHFSASKHGKVSTTTLFNGQHDYFEPWRKYLVKLKEDTIKVANPNYNMIVGAFQK